MPLKAGALCPRRSCRIVLLLPTALLIQTTLPSAASAMTARLLAYYQPGLESPSALDSLRLPAKCADFTCTVPADGKPHLWFVVVALEDTTEQIVDGVSFGLGDYDASAVKILQFGPCPKPGTGMQSCTNGWPKPKTGAMLVWPRPLDGPGTSGKFQPVYWFVARASRPCSIPLAGDPLHGAECVFYAPGRIPQGNEAEPQAGFAAPFGVAGFGQDGDNHCAGGGTTPAASPH